VLHVGLFNGALLAAQMLYGTVLALLK